MILRLILSTVIIAALIEVIFIAIAAIRLRSVKYGLLTFFWSFFGGLFGSSVGFFIGWLWYQLVLRTDPSFSNPNLSGLSHGLMAGYLIIVWFLCVQIGTIIGAIRGGACGLSYYRSPGKRI
jgi:hypothetical protein